ncbi:hypothetical protein E7T06_11585 [Deinococcus sp. Arct2-2]|uniref:hypothetical protein n=1 Tax=Deinococcus sp. Arct2-2 TaxID=2568653 RepID=UPI0010A56AC3|nr:hypothetical protein [Deinococcus sp. Arct2-2]THF69544.1 hypothetical protein E7T06_11585 [Deinococcus sp. Arct2-2]
MTQLPEYETQGQAAQKGAPEALPKELAKVKPGEAGLAWATPDGGKADRTDQSRPPGLEQNQAEGSPQAVQTDTAQAHLAQPDLEQTDSASNDQDTPTSLLARLRRGRQAAQSGTAQERAEQAVPTEDALRALLQGVPLNVQLHAATDAPLVAEERTRALATEPRPAGQINEEDFRRESHLRPEDLEELRAERTELLRAYLRSRSGNAGQTVSMPDFQQTLLTQSGWFGRSAWLERHLLAPWSVQAAPKSGGLGTDKMNTDKEQARTDAPGNKTVLLMAPRDRARFGSFVRVARAGGQTGTTSGREELEAQTRRPEVEEALAKARLEVVRAATARLFADWEQEADDLPPEETQTKRQARQKPKS